MLIFEGERKQQRNLKEMIRDYSSGLIPYNNITWNKFEYPFANVEQATFADYAPYHHYNFMRELMWET